MRKSIAFMISAWALVGAAGCQDSFANFLREERNLKNELADYLIRVVDDDTARYVVEGPAKKLKEKWSDHKQRVDTFIKAHDLTEVENIFKRLEYVDTYKWGWGDRGRDFTKHPDGHVTWKGPPIVEESARDAIETLTDVDLKKAMDAANARMTAQAQRISSIQPSGESLRKVANLPKEVFR
jgi:hypothetical protein